MAARTVSAERTAPLSVVSWPLMMVAAWPADRWLLRWVTSMPSALPWAPLALAVRPAAAPPAP